MKKGDVLESCVCMQIFFFFKKKWFYPSSSFLNVIFSEYL